MNCSPLFAPSVNFFPSPKTTVQNAYSSFSNPTAAQVVYRHIIPVTDFNSRRVWFHAVLILLYGSRPTFQSIFPSLLDALSASRIPCLPLTKFYLLSPFSSPIQTRLIASPALIGNLSIGSTALSDGKVKLLLAGNSSLLLTERPRRLDLYRFTSESR